MSSVEHIETSLEPLQKIQKFPAPTVQRGSFRKPAYSEHTTQHCRGFSVQVGNWKGLSFWFSFHERHHAKIYGYCVDRVILKTAEKPECSSQNRLHLVNLHVQEPTIGFLLTTKGTRLEPIWIHFNSHIHCLRMVWSFPSAFICILTDIVCVSEVHNEELVETALMHPFLCFISCKFGEIVLYKRTIYHKDHFQDEQWIYFKEHRLKVHKGSAVHLTSCILQSTRFHPLTQILRLVNCALPHSF